MEIADYVSGGGGGEVDVGGVEGGHGVRSHDRDTGTKVSGEMQTVERDCWFSSMAVSCSKAKSWLLCWFYRYSRLKSQHLDEDLPGTTDLL